MLFKNSKLMFMLSVAFLIVAIILATWGFPKIINRQIQKNIQIENSSVMYEKWVNVPVPLDFKVYLFNVSNAEEVNEGSKPKLMEIGPYVYKQTREKEVLGYGENDTIIYNLKKTFVFDPEASNGLSEDDDITVINFSYMGAILTINDMMPAGVAYINKALEEFFTNLTDPFSRVKVRDLLFDGIFLNCVGNNSALGLVCAKIRAEAPSTMRKAEEEGVNGFYFSMFSHMNRTASGPWAMKRGVDNMYEIGEIVSFKNQKAMRVWGDPYCGQINGSDSTVFPPIDEAKVPERLYTFEPEICRSLYVSLVGRRTLFNISAYYYELPESALAAKTANPDNKCFCKKNWSSNHDGCLLMGLLNLMPCQGAPAIASLPHFYLGSEELLDYAEGLKPDREKHSSFVYLDPTTGVALKGVKRLQFNIELRNMPKVPQLKSVPTGLFPLLWIEEGAELPTTLQEELREAHSLLSYVEAARWLILAIAMVCCVVAAAAVARAASLLSWPRNRNSVSFILGPTVPHVNKVQGNQ
uniref:Sensory neuron membrane proteins 2 n=1 Tax=Dendrolimus punctatus TaxID=238572 RepID=A0A2K8GL10_9NEOP|nr:sensory neuron membrane proteins 2 [Dendrolimus punctatus]